MNESCNYILPPDAKFNNKKLVWDEKYIGNFYPKVICKLYKTIDSITEIYVMVKLIFDEIYDESEEHILALVDLKKVDWELIDPRCYLNPGFNRTNIYLTSIIKYQINSHTKTKQLINQPGFHRVKGKLIYYCGTKNAICPKGLDKSDIVFEFSEKRLLIDDNLSEHEAIFKMMNLVKVCCNSGLFSFVYMLANIMKDAFAFAWKAPCFVLYIVADSGSKKTTIAAFITKLLDRDKAIYDVSQLGATEAAIKSILAEEVELVSVIDDSYPSRIGAVVRNLESNLNFICRTIGNSKIPGVKIGKKIISKIPQTAAIITAEFEISAGSEASRCLIIEETQQINKEKLIEHQREIYVVPTAFHYFITWYIEKYDMVCAFLKEMFPTYLALNIADHDRLNETMGVLDLSYQIYMMYCEEKGVATHDETSEELLAFQMLLYNAIKAQDARVKRNAGSKPEEIDSLEIVRRAYRNNSFCLSNNKKAWDESKHDGFIHGGCLYVRREKLEEKIRRIAPWANFDKIIKELKIQGALKTGDEGKNVISVRVGSVDNEKRRFYAIRLSELE